MPSKYPVCKSRQVTKALEKLGFRLISQKGSHAKYSNGINITVVPMHSEIQKGTLKGILDLGEVKLEDFMKVLK